MKTNWYKHVIIYFKHSIDVKFDLFSFKVCKKDAKWPKSVPERGQNHKIASNSATMSIWSLELAKT